MSEQSVIHFIGGSNVPVEGPTNEVLESVLAGRGGWRTFTSLNGSGVDVNTAHVTHLTKFFPTPHVAG